MPVNPHYSSHSDLSLFGFDPLPKTASIVSAVQQISSPTVHDDNASCMWDSAAIAARPAAGETDPGLHPDPAAPDNSRALRRLGSDMPCAVLLADRASTTRATLQRLHGPPPGPIPFAPSASIDTMPPSNRAAVCPPSPAQAVAAVASAHRVPVSQAPADASRGGPVCEDAGLGGGGGGRLRRGSAVFRVLQAAPLAEPGPAPRVAPLPLSHALAAGAPCDPTSPHRRPGPGGAESGACGPCKREVDATFLAARPVRSPHGPNSAGCCGGTGSLGSGSGRGARGAERVAVPKLWSSGHTPRGAPHEPEPPAGSAGPPPPAGCGGSGRMRVIGDGAGWESGGGSSRSSGSSVSTTADTILTARRPPHPAPAKPGPHPWAVAV
jgi:hypothetical protein